MNIWISSIPWPTREARSSGPPIQPSSVIRSPSTLSPCYRSSRACPNPHAYAPLCCLLLSRCLALSVALIIVHAAPRSTIPHVRLTPLCVLAVGPPKLNPHSAAYVRGAMPAQSVQRRQLHAHNRVGGEPVPVHARVPSSPSFETPHATPTASNTPTNSSSLSTERHPRFTSYQMTPSGASPSHRSPSSHPSCEPAQDTIEKPILMKNDRVMKWMKHNM
ncbi:hypothetical protein HYPSUDRAFT_200273 [Hypholoma sublateritium FD-334 SS-4]|uniref:Uncharacterized protein n=1 Tax=Hypholoma sublateritium (strain FD-334 SS-4) TaxID=945553 RepID=A0A0D2PZF6_HYPSF|nr:hypothetical protein HYPSUDRAFT_200273 [Hypholoma sublateritium FD-334 SS-4]